MKHIEIKQRKVSIQILRISACLMVFLVHFGQRVEMTGILKRFADFGAYGVHLFFLISGFLAARTLFDNPCMDVKKYYLKRAIAILPLYYIVIAYYFITENILNQFVPVIPADELGVGWIRYVFLLNGFLNSDTYFWSNLGITWTIPIFVFFYLIAPLFLRKIKSVLGAVSVWFCVFGVSIFLKYFFACTILTNIHYLFLGVVLYACVTEKKCKLASVFFQMASIAALILQIDSATYVFLFASVILVLVSLDKDIVLSEKVQKVVDILDRYSYTAYLMHGVVFCSVLDRLNSLKVEKWVIAISAVVGTLLATWFVGKFIEKPIQKWLREKWIK